MPIVPTIAMSSLADHLPHYCQEMQRQISSQGDKFLLSTHTPRIHLFLYVDHQRVHQPDFPNTLLIQNKYLSSHCIFVYFQDAESLLNERIVHLRVNRGHEALGWNADRKIRKRSRTAQISRSQTV